MSNQISPSSAFLGPQNTKTAEPPDVQAIPRSIEIDATGLNAPPSGEVLRAYNPISWYHSKGIHRVISRLRPRLPDVGGNLFLTFTVNPVLYSCPDSAYEHSRDRLRRIFYLLRKGVEWEGKRYVIDAPYCVKVEFHRNGWAHFHIIFLTRRFLPGALLTKLWGLGRTDVRRITNEHFHYLLKYVSKGGGLPDWVLTRNRIRIFQSSRGFLLPAKQEPEEIEHEEAEPKKHKKRASFTIGERIKRWSMTALLGSGNRCRQIFLSTPFTELFNELVYSVAVAGRYLGNGEILINDIKDLIEWIIPKTQPSPL